MCGIFGVIPDLNNNAAETVLRGLQKLEYRGYDSWGIAIKSDKQKKLVVEKHIGKIGGAKTSLPKSTIGIGHTRWATHGGVTDANAHPHLDCSQQIAVLHNGIVENYQELKETLKQKGHTFLSETDTEVIAHLVEEKAKTKSFFNAVTKSFNEFIGLNAIAVLDYESETIIVCRNGSPLVLGIGKSEYYFASDVTAFLDKTNQVIFLSDGEGAVLEKTGFRVFNTQTGKEIKSKIQKLNWKIKDAEKGGYPHFLLKEIMEQKVSIPKALVSNTEIISDLADKIKDDCNIVMTGCGSAYNCGLAAKYLFSESAVQSEVYGSYEMGPFLQTINKKTVLFAISQSGETADTLIVAKQAKKQGAVIVAIVNAKGSTLERMADYVLAVGAGPEIAVVSTKAFTAQLATLTLLAKSLNNKTNDFDFVKKSLDSWLTKKLQNKILKLAKDLVDHEHVYIIGKYLNYPAGLEFAMKLKETSYIHAEAFASGELKHGVIALIQKGTPCIVLTSNDSIRGEVLSSAAEMKARGALIIGVGPQNAKEFDTFIETPNSPPFFSIYYNIIIGQMLGYYLGVGRGTDPDKPRNLAKSVTVK